MPSWCSERNHTSPLTCSPTSVVSITGPAGPAASPAPSGSSSAAITSRPDSLLPAKYRVRRGGERHARVVAVAGEFHEVAALDTERAGVGVLFDLGEVDQLDLLVEPVVVAAVPAAADLLV